MGSTRLSLLFSFAEKYTLLVLGIAGTMALARLLTPAEIGVYAVGAVLVGMAQVVRDFGVGQYLIQEAQLDREKARAALSVSLFVAWTLAALVWLAGAPVAAFYGDARLQGVLRLLSLNFLLIPFSSLTLSLLRRQLRFSAIFTINAAHGVTQLLVSVTLALRGFGYLSLVYAAVAATVAALLASLCLRPASLPWLPGCKGVRRVLAFGALSTGGGLVDEAGVAAPDLIIGKMIDIGSVGIFGKAQGALNIFNQAITSAISPVVFPLFAARARDGGDVRRAYLATVTYMTALAWPFFTVLACMALPLVNLLYGPQWNAAVPLIRIMCFSSAIYSMFSMARYLFVATGHVKAQARLDATAVPLRVAALVLAAPFGLPWVAVAVVVGAVLRCWLIYRCLVRLSGLRFGALLAAVRQSLVLSAAAALAPALVLLMAAPRPGHWIAPLALAGCGALLGWGVAIILLQHPIKAEVALLGRRAWAPQRRT